MELTDITIKILFLFLPGIILCLLIPALTERNFASSLFHFVINAFVLGCLSYILLEIVYLIINAIWIPSPLLHVSFFKNVDISQDSIDFFEILYVSICALILGLFISKCINSAYLHRFAKFLRISNSTGDKDVWRNVLNKKEVEWIVIRDKKNDLIYEGWLEQYSATFTDGELFLKSVEVFKDTTGEKYYELEGLYLIFNKETMTIEFREFTERKKKNEGK